MGLYEAQYIKKGTEDKNIMLKYDGNEMEFIIDELSKTFC